MPEEKTTSCLTYISC